MQNKLKFFILLIFITFNNAVFAISNTELLNNIENDIYGYDFSKDSTQNRIVRLEKTVYGKAKSGDVNKRISALSKDISADVIGQEIEPVRDTFLAMEEMEEDNSVNYPVVNEIEQKLFNKTYKNRDFHTRIVTIEKKLFGKVYDVDDYPTRLDRIKSRIMPETVANSERFENEYHDSEYAGKFSQGKKKLLDGLKIPFGQRNYTRHYANYGDYGDFSDSTSEGVVPHDNLSDELSQMEYDMFGTEFSNEDTQTRIKRLNSVNKAKKSKSKYDSQKFGQYMSTAMEVGAMILMILAMVL